VIPGPASQANGSGKGPPRRLPQRPIKVADTIYSKGRTRGFL
jgi:hypothetical protein